MDLTNHFKIMKRMALIRRTKLKLRLKKTNEFLKIVLILFMKTQFTMRHLKFSKINYYNLTNILNF